MKTSKHKRGGTTFISSMNKSSKRTSKSASKSSHKSAYTHKTKPNPKGKSKAGKESRRKYSNNLKLGPYNQPTNKTDCKPIEEAKMSEEEIIPKFDILQKAIIQTKSLHIEETVHEQRCGSLLSKFTLFQDDTEIGNIQVMVSSAIIDDVEVEIPAILVKWIEINDAFKGRGYSKILLLYGILQYKIRFPYIKYAMLDDDSDACITPSKNVYWKMGFVPATRIHSDEEIDLPITIKQDGPEMLLTFKSSRLYRFLNDVCDSLNPCVKSPRCKR